jgi:hypothetical protein
MKPPSGNGAVVPRRSAESLRRSSQRDSRRCRIDAMASATSRALGNGRQRSGAEPSALPFASRRNSCVYTRIQACSESGSMMTCMP